MADESLYDEFGNYIGPELSESEVRGGGRGAMAVAAGPDSVHGGPQQRRRLLCSSAAFAAALPLLWP